MEFYSGQQVTFSGLFTVADEYADPDTARFTIYNATSGSATYTYPDDGEIVREATGRYYVNFVLTAPGLHRVYWYASGTVNAATGATVKCLGFLPNG